MNFLESLKVAIEGLLANRLRSALTMLGVIFGVGAVIGAVSMTQGARLATLAQFERLGTTTLTVRPGQARRGPVRGGLGAVYTLTYSDALALKEQAPSVTAVAPEVQFTAQVKAGNQNTATQIVGTTVEYPVARDFQLTEGLFFSERDLENRRRVAVLGPTVVENLWGSGRSVAGELIRINGVTFNVIGQFSPKGDTGVGWWTPDDQIVIPITTALYRMGASPSAPGAPRDSVRMIGVKFEDLSLAQQAQAEVETILRERHGIRPGEESDFHIMSPAEMVEGAMEASRVMTMLFGAIAAVSLLVGGIGIMNIMLVSVTERTREIGLRKALGATPRDILGQFLIESVTLSLLGGLLGIGLGVGIAYILRLVNMNTSISYGWVAVSFSFAAFVGIFFGLLPAKKAARLDPIEALRYE